VSSSLTVGTIQFIGSNRAQTRAGGLEAIGPAPHRQHELHDQLFGPVTAIAPRLRQTARAQRRLKADAIKQALH